MFESVKNPLAYPSGQRAWWRGVVSSVLCVFVAAGAAGAVPEAVATGEDFARVRAAVKRAIDSSTHTPYVAAFTMLKPEILRTTTPEELQHKRTCSIRWEGDRFWSVSRFEYLTPPSRAAAVMSYPRGLPTTEPVVLGRIVIMVACRDQHGTKALVVNDMHILNERDEITEKFQDGFMWRGKSIPDPVAEFSSFVPLILNGMVGDWVEESDSEITRAAPGTFEVRAEKMSLFTGGHRGLARAMITDAGRLRELRFVSDRGDLTYDIVATGERRCGDLVANEDAKSTSTVFGPANDTPGYNYSELKLLELRLGEAECEVRDTVERVFSIPEIVEKQKSSEMFLRNIDSGAIKQIVDQFDFEKARLRKP